MLPLSGTRVLDLTHAVAGPFCTYHLHLLGADVIKIERPDGGDQLRHTASFPGPPDYSSLFVCVNAGKRSLALDLKQPEARAVCLRIARQADVVVENFAPGVLARLGLGWEDLRRENPRLIYCSISGFGQTGELRDRTAYDHIIQAMSGVMWTTGEPEQPPLRVGIPLADLFSGYQAHAAVLAALLQRAHSGQGQYIDVAMLDALLVLLSAQVTTTSMNGQPPERISSTSLRAEAGSGIFRARDGYVALGANHPHQFEALCRALGRPELIADQRFATVPARRANRLALREVLDEELARWPALELERELARVRVPVSVVRTLPQTLALPGIGQRGSLAAVTVPGLPTPATIVQSGYVFAHDSPQVRGPLPAIGQHSEEILREHGFADSEIASLREARVI
jgi:crotonobetainyl-CoA:carnitine CoA-transferase CaiB-like acyl-CoA transferase